MREPGRGAAPLPRELYVEVTNRCNSLCLTCPLTWGGHEAKKDLSYSEFLALVDELPAIRRVVLHGIGEPLLNRELPRMIADLKARGATVVFNSNAIALVRRIQRQLIGSGLDELRISLDAGRPETYARIRGVDAMERVLANVGALVGLQREMGVQTPRLSLWFTGMRDNIAELPDLVRAAARHGIPEVHLQRLVYRGVGMAVAEQAIYRSHDEAVATAVAEAEALADGLGIVLTHSGGDGAAATVPSGAGGVAPWHGCSRPWRLAYVTANGNVLPCCIAPFTGAPYESIVLGNVRDGSLAQVWNGARYQEFRARHASIDNPPECCRLCGDEWSLLFPMISVIIPTLNEQEIIAAAIQALLAEPTGCEILVVDGKSSDQTAPIVRSFGPPVRLLEQDPDGPRGRGAAYNQAARLAQGDILLFLHADTRLPSGGLCLIEAALAERAVLGGGFLPTFDGAGHGWARVVLDAVEQLWRLSTKAFHWFVGDQAPFLRREVFLACGGCPTVPLAEDLAFASRLRSLRRLVVIDRPVTVSVRRHLANGVLRTLLVIGSIDVMYWAGVKPSFLAECYRRWLPHER